MNPRVEVVALDCLMLRLFDEIAEILWDHQMKPLLDERMANYANAIPVEIDELIS